MSILSAIRAALSGGAVSVFRSQIRSSVLVCAVAILVCLDGVALAQPPAIVTQIPQTTQPPKDTDAPPVGDHMKGIESKEYRIDPNKRDFAEITFSVDSDVEHFTQFPGRNYVKWRKKIRFDGKVRLKYVYGGGIYTTGGLAEMEQLPPTKEIEYIAEGWKACEKETDPVAMGTCTAAATRAGEAKFKKCSATPPASREAEGCGGGTSKPPPFMGDYVGPSRGKDRYDETPQGDLRAWEAMTCIGRTKVHGFGEGFDQSLTAQVYTITISAEHEAEALHVGTSGGCTAGATVDVKTGKVQLFLQPSPRNIMTKTTYSDFRKVARAPFKTFEGLEGDSIMLDLVIPPGSKTFSGSWSPPSKPISSPDDPGVTHKVQTVVHYNFNSE